MHTREANNRSPSGALAARAAVRRLFLAALLTASSTFGQSAAFSTASEDWQGLSEFVRMAQSKWGSGAVKVTAELNYDELSSSDSLVIFAPENRLDADSLTALLASGGRVVVLDDYGQSPSFLARFGIRRVAIDKTPRQTLRNDADLPIAEAAIESLGRARAGRHPMTLGVEHVALNHPMFLEHPELTPVLDVTFADGSSAPVAVTGIISGRGRLVAIGDPSVFINLMLRYPGNRGLAEGLLDYLMERDPGESGPRTLWIVAGDFTQVGSFGERSDLSARFREGVQSISNAADTLRKEGLPAPLALALAGILALFILARELKRNVSAPLALVPGFARARPLAAQMGPASRAEVLGGSHTSPLLSVIEMDVAIREALEIRLKLSSGLARDGLLAGLEQRGLSRADARDLVSLLDKTRSWGASLAARRPVRPSRSELKQVHDKAMHLLTLIRRAEQKR
jgi:hypothetical protein